MHFTIDLKHFTLECLLNLIFHFINLFAGENSVEFKNKNNELINAVCLIKIVFFNLDFFKLKESYRIIFLSYLLCILILDCSYKQEVRNYANLRNQNQFIHLITEDRILKEVICESILNSTSGKCLENTAIEFEYSKFKIKEIKVDAEIKNSSSDYFKNVGKSILTLTLGVFISNSAEIQFKIQRNPNDKALLASKELNTNGSIERWAVLPFYAGFGATNLGTIFNTYRNPEHLQRYCLYETISDLRNVLEATRDDYCENYSEFLRNSFYKIENEFLNLIQEGK